MQLDAEEDEQAFYKPPVEPTARRNPDSMVSNDGMAAAVVTADEDD